MSRRFLIFFCLLFVGVFTCVAQETKEKTKTASIQFDSMNASIGTFPRSEAIKTATYTFKNVGKEKLVFYAAKVSCGCITVDFPDKPIKPGRKGKVTVSYNGTNKDPGRFNYKIYFSVSGKPSHFILRLSGEMTKN